MKKLHLIRHAKSSWQDASLADINRPLNKRGINTCEFMAQHIFDAGCQFMQVFCSPAQRARSTIELISDAISEQEVKWQVIQQLYTFDSTHLLNWCENLDDSIVEPVIVGHNPALTELCNRLCATNINNIATCGYAQLTATDDCSWKELSQASFELTTLLRPKALIT